jgi:hypothetical protein
MPSHPERVRRSYAEYDSRSVPELLRDWWRDPEFRLMAYLGAVGLAIILAMFFWVLAPWR